MRKYMQELTKQFVQGSISAYTKTASIRGNVFYSYNTPIAYRKPGTCFYLNMDKYSTTTSGQQNALKEVFDSCGLEYTIVNEEELNTIIAA
jgi:hypothetical protein